MAIDRRLLSKPSASSLDLLEESDLKNVPDLFLVVPRPLDSLATEAHNPFWTSVERGVLVRRPQTCVDHWFRVLGLQC